MPLPPSAPGRRAHDIDFTIHGNEMQFVEVELDPGEAAVAEAGSMMYMTDGVQLETIFGDGSKAQSAGVLDALLGAGKRILTGESLFMTVFTNTASGKQRVAFAAPYAGKIIPMDLKAIGGQLDLPEGLVPVRRARRVGRHRLPAQDWRRHLRRRGLHHAEARRRRPVLRARRRIDPLDGARRRRHACVSTPGAWWRSSQA